MVYKAVQFLAQGDLPSPDKLIELKKQGFTHLLNLSGVALAKLYSTEQLTDFTLAEFTFKDVFSTGITLQAQQTANIDCALYCEQASQTERAQFFSAVQQLIDWLKKGNRTYVFCHQGIGRSPCVILAALAHYYQPKPDALLKTVKFLNQQAILTATSYAAAKWFDEQVNMKV